MSITVKSPADCSRVEIHEFIALAELSGEVQKEGLQDLIQQAETLAYLRINGACVGIAGLKRPRSQYKRRVFANSKCDHSPDDCLYELGWVYIDEAHRRRGYSRQLVQKLLASACGENVYATSRADELFMHRSLQSCGFVNVGTSWRSSRREGKDLLLLIRVKSDVHADDHQY